MADDNVVNLFGGSIPRNETMHGDKSESAAPLQFGGGGGTSGIMEIVDAKIAAAEARTDAKFAELIGELRTIERATSGIKTTVVATGFTAVALVVAVFAWGNAMFGSGMDAQSVADRAVSSVEQRLSDQLKTTQTQNEELAVRLDQLASENSSTWAQVLDAIRSDNEISQP